MQVTEAGTLMLRKFGSIIHGSIPPALMADYYTITLPPTTFDRLKSDTANA